MFCAPAAIVQTLPVRRLAILDCELLGSNRSPSTGGDRFELRQPPNVTAVQESVHEAHVSAKQSQAGNEAWLPGSQVHSWRSRRFARSPPQGSSQAQRLSDGIDRRRTPNRPDTESTTSDVRAISRRACFAALRGRDAVRVGARGAPVRVSYVATLNGAAIDDAEIGFVIGRQFGTAVDRNRARRRLRAALREIDAQRSLAHGAYLFRPNRRVLTAPFDDLTVSVAAAIDAITESAGTSP